MDSKSFVYWLQGFFELAEPNKGLSPRQVEIIKNHLKLVFLYEIDPSYSKDKVVQQIFQNIHDGKESLKDLKITKAEKTTPVHKPKDEVMYRC